MPTQYNTNFSETFPFSDTNFMLVTPLATAISLTVPGTPNQIYRTNFSIVYGDEVYVRLNGTATLPGASLVTPITYQELIGLNFYRYVKGGDTLSFISIAAASLSVSLLLVQQTV